MAREIKNRYYETVNEIDEENVPITLIDTKKNLILQHFKDYTPLPDFVIHIIMDDYFCDSDEMNLWSTKWQININTKYNIYRSILMIYSVLMFIVNLLCLILIIWINIDGLLY